MTAHIDVEVWHNADYKFQDGGQNGGNKVTAFVELTHEK